MRVHVFGDSHAAFCFDRAPDVEIHWLGPKTMHGFSMDAENTLRASVPTSTPGDIFAFIFGEIDIRCHLLKIAEREKRPVYSIVEDLAYRYVSSISCAMRTYPECLPVVIQPPFPTDSRPNPDLPFVGTIQERVELHRTLSSILSGLCKDRSISYMPMPDVYSENSGRLNSKYSDGSVHIISVEASEVVRSLGRIVGRKFRFNRCWTDIAIRRFRYYFGIKTTGRGGLKRRY